MLVLFRRAVVDDLGTLVAVVLLAIVFMAATELWYCTTFLLRGPSKT